MPREKTPDSRNFLTRSMDRVVRPRRPDVQLSLESGQEPDPRLPSSKAAGIRKSLSEAARGFKAVRKLGSR